MKDEIPVCATIPTADRRLGGMSRYHGKSRSNLARVALAMSPEIFRNQARVCFFVMALGMMVLERAARAGSGLSARGPARSGCDIKEAILRNRLVESIGCYLAFSG
jgi:hypothetical protein